MSCETTRDIDLRISDVVLMRHPVPKKEPNEPAAFLCLPQVKARCGRDRLGSFSARQNQMADLGICTGLCSSPRPTRMRNHPKICFRNVCIPYHFQSRESCFPIKTANSGREVNIWGRMRTVQIVKRGRGGSCRRDVSAPCLRSAKAGSGARFSAERGPFWR
jgi:hypothetical protein